MENSNWNKLKDLQKEIATKIENDKIKLINERLKLLGLETTVEKELNSGEARISRVINHDKSETYYLHYNPISKVKLITLNVEYKFNPDMNGYSVVLMVI